MNINLIESFRNIKNPRVFIYALIGFIIAFTCLILRLKDMPGPFIFGDESLYLSLGRTLHEDGVFRPVQYGFFYPFLISFIFKLGLPIVATYKIIILFNIFFYSLSFFAWYKISLILFNAPRLCMLIAMALTLMPMSGLSGAVWAEPVFYSLYSFFWLASFLYIFADPNKRTRWAIALGVIAGLMLLTKQSAVIGIVTTSFLLVGAKKDSWKQHVAIFFGLIIMTYLMYYMLVPTINTKGFGYANVTHTFLSRWKDILFLSPFYINFLYHLAHIALTSFFFIVPIITWLFRSKSKKTPTWWLMISTILCSIGLCFLNALFYSTWDSSYGLAIDTSQLSGRYITIITPVIILLGIKALLDFTKKDFLTLSFIGGLLVFASLNYFFSPLHSIHAQAIFNTQDTLFLLPLFGVHDVPWGKDGAMLFADAHALHAVLLYLAFFLLLALLMTTKKNIIAAGLLLIACANASQVHARMVNYMAMIAEPENQVFKYLLEQNIALDKVTPSKSEFANTAKIDFWFGTKVTEEFIKRKQQNSNLPSDFFICDKECPSDLHWNEIYNFKGSRVLKFINK